MSEGKRLIINNNFVNFNIQPPLNNPMMMNKNQNQMMPMNQMGQINQMNPPMMPMNQMGLMNQMNQMNQMILMNKMNNILNNVEKKIIQPTKGTNYLENQPPLQIDEEKMAAAIKHNKEFFFNPDNDFLFTNEGWCWEFSVVKLFLTNKNFLQILINFKNRHKGDEYINSPYFDKDLQNLQFTENEKLAAMHCFGYDNLTKDAQDNFKRLKRVLYLIGVLCKNIDENGKIKNIKIEEHGTTISSTKRYTNNNEAIKLQRCGHNFSNQLYKNLIVLFDIDRRYNNHLQYTSSLFLQCMYIMNAELNSYNALMLWEDSLTCGNYNNIFYKIDKKNTSCENAIYNIPGSHFFNFFKNKDGQYYTNGYNNPDKRYLQRINEQFELTDNLNALAFKDMNFCINEPAVLTQNEAPKSNITKIYVDEAGYDFDEQLILQFFDPYTQKNTDDNNKKIDLNKIYQLINVDRSKFVNLTYDNIIDFIHEEITNHNKDNNDNRILKSYVDEDKQVIIHITNNGQAIFSHYEYYFNSKDKKIFIEKDPVIKDLTITINSFQHNGVSNELKGNDFINIKLDNKGEIDVFYLKYYDIYNDGNKIEIYRREQDQGSNKIQKTLRKIYDGKDFYSYLDNGNDKKYTKINKNDEEKFTEIKNKQKVFSSVSIDDYICNTKAETLKQYNNNNNNNNELVTKYHITDIKKSNHLFETENNINYNNNNYINNNSIHQNDNNNIIPHNNNNNDVLIFENGNDKTCFDKCGSFFSHACNGMKLCFNDCCRVGSNCLRRCGQAICNLFHH